MQAPINEQFESEIECITNKLNQMNLHVMSSAVVNLVMKYVASASNLSLKVSPASLKIIVKQTEIVINRLKAEKLQVMSERLNQLLLEFKNNVKNNK